MNLQPVPGIENQSRAEHTAMRTDSAISVVKAAELKSAAAAKENAVNKDEGYLERLLDQAEKMAGVFGRNLKFRYRKEADVFQVEVIDAESSEIVRKIPSDEMVRFIENINEMLGALFDTQA